MRFQGSGTLDGVFKHHCFGAWEMHIRLGFGLQKQELGTLLFWLGSS